VYKISTGALIIRRDTVAADQNEKNGRIGGRTSTI
jgi:hypothetical protein